ncbi:histidine phosphatase family protein [Nitrobacter sp. NHB1]|uniref:SixA phosphatase family protein n=1 Tax=Nitrobacter sp. NHB1 TaxID=3119830 RepID=UPI002FFDA938
MRRLLLLRHAKAESTSPSGRDRDRPLAARGRQDAAELGAWLAGQRSLLPDLALISTAVRARETWDIVQQQISDKVPLSDGAPRELAAHLPDLYGAEPVQLLAIIRSLAAEDPERLMIVGHNPCLHELALGLIGRGDTTGRATLAHNLPTSGLVVIDFAVESWDRLAFGNGQLAQFVSPKLLKEA